MANSDISPVAEFRTVEPPADPLAANPQVEPLAILNIALATWQSRLDLARAADADPGEIRWLAGYVSGLADAVGFIRTGQPEKDGDVRLSQSKAESPTARIVKVGNVRILKEIPADPPVTASQARARIVKVAARRVSLHPIQPQSTDVIWRAIKLYAEDCRPDFTNSMSAAIVAYIDKLGNLEDGRADKLIEAIRRKAYPQQKVY